MLSRGRFLEAILKAERGWRSRGCARNAGSGGSETVRRALRPVLRGARCTISGGNAGDGRAEPNHQIARWSAGRRARRSQGGRRASLARPIPSAPLGAPPPLIGRQTKVQHPGAKRAAATVRRLCSMAGASGGEAKRTRQARRQQRRRRQGYGGLAHPPAEALAKAGARERIAAAQQRAADTLAARAANEPAVAAVLTAAHRRFAVLAPVRKQTMPAAGAAAAAMRSPAPPGSGRWPARAWRRSWRRTRRVGRRRTPPRSISRNGRTRATCSPACRCAWSCGRAPPSGKEFGSRSDPGARLFDIVSSRQELPATIALIHRGQSRVAVRQSIGYSEATAKQRRLSRAKVQGGNNFVR